MKLYLLVINAAYFTIFVSLDFEKITSKWPMCKSIEKSPYPDSYLQQLQSFLLICASIGFCGGLSVLKARYHLESAAEIGKFQRLIATATKQKDREPIMILE